MEKFKENLNYYRKRRLFKYTIPFLMLVVGGSFGLKEFSQLRLVSIQNKWDILNYVFPLRYQFSNKKTIRPDEVEKFGVKMKKEGEVTLETEYDKIKNLDIDNWENKRGPRPWENTNMS